MIKNTVRLSLMKPLLYNYTHYLKEITSLTSLHPGLASSWVPSAGLIEAFFLQMYPYIFSQMWSAHLPFWMGHIQQTRTAPLSLRSSTTFEAFEHLSSYGCYLSSDEDTVFLEVGGMRWLISLPLGEGNVGVIRPFKQHLVLQVIQANPEHICRH